MDLVIVCTLNYFYKGRSVSKSRLVGVFLVAVAVWIEGISQFVFAQAKDTSAAATESEEWHFFAIGLMVFRSFQSACQQFVDEELTQQDCVPALVVAGTHGVIGVAIMFFGMLIAGPYIGEKWMILPILGALFQSPLSSGTTCFAVLMGAGDHFLNKLGVKNAGALGKTVAKSLRPTLTWLLNLIVAATLPVFGGEVLHGVDSMWHVLALLLQFAGTLTYAEQISCPPEALMGKKDDDEDET